ncbi:DUF4013 domain-containing protein [Candidatus Woesearchaeota archaeon]|nr:DUF4013 domain-containing protein [Candidatus Woesearchaeota archaeon]
MTVTINEALKYPFVRFGRLFYWLWMLIPVLGWLAFSGYVLRIVQNVIKGKYKESPKFGRFWSNCELGLYAWILGILVGFVSMAAASLQVLLGLWGIVIYYVVLIYISLISPILMIQLAETENLKNAFNFVRAHKIVFGNFVPYIIILLKQVVVTLVLLLASLPVVTIIFTFPAMSYSKQYLYARFYRDVKKKPKY